MIRPSLIVLMLGLAGCGRPLPVNDAGVSDAGVSDSGVSDAGLSDAGLSDAGASDAGLGTALTADQKSVAEALTSIWENDTPVLDYAYAENIHDGRGYTCGRAGFCTGTGDAILVVRCFVQARPGNALAKYLPALETIYAQYMSTGQDQATTATLDALGNFPLDWSASASDSEFHRCQDAVVDQLYFQPAMNAAASTGLESALAKATLYDTWINQGDDTLVLQTNTALGVSGVGGAVTEDAWLAKFIELRRDLLWGDSTWRSAVDRIAGYEKARRQGNWQLSSGVDTAVRALDCWPGRGYTSSGYTKYLVAPNGSAMQTTVAFGCR